MSAMAHHDSFLARAFTSIRLYRDYRFVWLGSCSEHLGEWMEITALLWLLNDMTHSPFLGTLMVALRFLPATVFAFVGGVVADRADRRALLISALLASCVLSVVLATIVHLGAIRPWHLLVYSALSGVILSFNHPARNTLVPNLVKKEHYLNAITLDNSSVTASRVVGAPLAGFIIGSAGTTPVLGLRAAGALLAILWLLLVRVPPMSSDARRKTPWRNFTEGMEYVWRRKEVLTQVLLYLLPIFITNSYTGVLPYFARNNLGVGPDLYGILNAAPGIGAVGATLMLASLVQVRRKGLFLLLAGIAQGVGLLLFAMSPYYVVCVLLLIVVGGTNTAFMTLNNTLIQEIISDEMRGRVTSLREVSLGLGPSGSLVSGALAGMIGVPLALGFAGGVSLVVLLGILIGIPRAWHRG